MNRVDVRQWLSHDMAAELHRHPRDTSPDAPANE
jgi:hypothetical protein